MRNAERGEGGAKTVVVSRRLFQVTFGRRRFTGARNHFASFVDFTACSWLVLGKMFQCWNSPV